MLFKGHELSIDEKTVNSIRSLGIDMIDEAKSGHPGIVLGAAPILYTLYKKHLKINPNDPNWFDRDRFVLSAGHGSALLYATLFLAGYNIELSDLKKFRQYGSITPGHPEYKVTPGVDMSTGPLGQGISSAVGMAIGEEYLRNYFLKLGKPIVNHYTYVLCGDGDIMEGISYEALSLAGTLKLNKLIVIYDANKICLDGEVNKVMTENIPARFNAMNWNVFLVQDGDDLASIDGAIEKAKTSIERPNLIIVNTTIGKYSELQGTNKVHGSPLKKEDILSIKEKMGVRTIPFTITNDVIESFQNSIHQRIDPIYENYNKLKDTFDDNLKELFEKLENESFSLDDLSIDYEAPIEKEEELRETGSKVLNELAKNNPFLIGGSADLASSTKVHLNKEEDFTSRYRLGRNICYGVREHAMGAISNGLALAGLRPFASTFLTFSDYLKPAIRMSALMNLPTVYIFTHDSFKIGEDGPTHQPVEQLIGLRSIPNLEVFRPADANEVIGVYKYVMSKNEGPSVIVLGRNKSKIQDSTSIKDIQKGGYIVKEEAKNLGGIIISNGEELQIAIDIADKLNEKGYDIRVVSMPSIELFRKQSKVYQEKLLPEGVKTFVIEASSSYSWDEFVYNRNYLITMDQFGKSAKRIDLEKKFKFDEESILKHIENLLQ